MYWQLRKKSSHEQNTPRHIQSPPTPSKVQYAVKVEILLANYDYGLHRTSQRDAKYSNPTEAYITTTRTLHATTQCGHSQLGVLTPFGHLSRPRHKNINLYWSPRITFLSGPRQFQSMVSQRWLSQTSSEFTSYIDLVSPKP